MPRRWTWGCWTASNLVLTALLALVAGGCGKSLSNIHSENKNSVELEPTDPEFAVPDGSPEKILEFVRELRGRRPEFKSQEQVAAYVKKMQGAMVTASDKILAQQADDASLREAASIKLGITIGSALSRQLKPSELDAAIKKSFSVVDQLRTDKRKAVAETAKDFVIAARAVGVKSMSASERAQLADEAVQLVSKSDSRQLIGNVDFLADQLVSVDENELALSLYDRLAKVIDDSSDDTLKRYARDFRAKAARLSIKRPGGQLEIEGALLDGGQLDWPSYRGKVVLVDFWATWCGPCVAEIPNVIASYQAYHSRGFEVIGISLDNDRKALESFLERKQIPWKQLFEDPASRPSGGIHPMAEKYGINSIPAAFLVDREGRVVSTDARGPELERHLKTLFE